MNWRVWTILALMPVTSILAYKAVTDSVGNIFKRDKLALVDLDKPSEMLAGYNQPRRVFIDDKLVNVPLSWSWNYLPKKPTDTTANWLSFGSVGTETEDMLLGVLFRGQTPIRHSNIRSEISGLKTFKRKKIRPRFFGRNRKIETKHGPLTTAVFAYKHNGNTKICIGFISDASEILIKGFYCAEHKTRPDQNKLACIVNSIKIYEQAYWIEPKGVGQKSTSCLEPDASA